MGSVPHIVRLDGWVSPSPTFSPSFKHQYTSHDRTLPDPEVISSRLINADIAITSRVPITAKVLEKCPRLKVVALFGIGTDLIDLKACKKYGVKVCNVPAASNEAVAEHAIALYFALRRCIIGTQNRLVSTEDWVKNGSLVSVFGGLPSTCREEVMGIIGAGELGNRVANIGRALGMTVLLSDRKMALTLRPGRTPFAEVLAKSTILMITASLSPQTQNLLSTLELALVRPDALIINVARGGIVNEEALVTALKEGKVKGVASDVFVEEPASSADSALLRAAREWKAGEGRIVVTPHVAWVARKSIENMRRVSAENIEGWAEGGDAERKVHYVELDRE